MSRMKEQRSDIVQAIATLNETLDSIHATMCGSMERTQSDIECQLATIAEELILIRKGIKL